MIICFTGVKKSMFLLYRNNAKKNDNINAIYTVVAMPLTVYSEAIVFLN